MRPFLHRIQRWQARQRWRKYGTGSRDGSSHVRLGLWLVAIFTLHSVAMVEFEGLSPFDAIWLSSTTIATVGYGDLAAKTTAGRLSTMGLMYVGAIFVLAKAVNDWLDAKAYKNERKLHGTWDWKMNDHLLIIGTPTGVHAMERASEFFLRLVGQIHAVAEWRDTPIQLLSTIFAERGLPLALRDQGVVHYVGRPTSHNALAACYPEWARTVIVLADSETGSVSDAVTFDTISRLRSAGCVGRIIAECVDDENRRRLMAAGASSVVRPLRGYPEMLARAVIAPGSEEILADLFTAEGDECRRIDLKRPWRGSWIDLCKRVLDARIGTPLGYADAEGKVRTNTMADDHIEAVALFLIVNNHQPKDAHRLGMALEQK